LKNENTFNGKEVSQGVPSVEVVEDDRRRADLCFASRKVKIIHDVTAT